MSLTIPARSMPPGFVPVADTAPAALPSVAPTERAVSPWLDLFGPFIGTIDHERLLVAGMDEGGRLVTFVEQRGGSLYVDRALTAVRQAIGHPRTVLLVIAHNHPDGDAKPSASDRHATRLIARLARAANTTLVDHLILAGKDWFSFADNHMI